MIRKRILALALLFSLLFSSNFVLASSYTRPNSFLNAKGAERVHQIKKFQAINNLMVTGGLNNETTDMLHNPNIGPFDKVDKAPSNGYWIVVNKSKRILTLYKGIKVAGKYPVALGTKYTPTPSAKATISNMAKNPAWGGMGGKYKPRASNDPLNPLGERWMGLKIPGETGYGIHGTIKPNEVGTNASNGCIRMFNYDVENFVYPKMNPGDPVWIGTTEELKSWGVVQYIDKQTPSNEKPPVNNNPGESKPEQEEKQPSKPVENQRGVDVLVF